jgi:hypothetical protein
MCTETSCPEGEVCVLGFCTTTCTDTSDCPQNFSCIGSVCAPGGDTSGSDAGDVSSAEDASESDGDSTAADSTATTGGAT